MPRSRRPAESIKDVFYETRALMGREYSLRRFAVEVLGDAVDPVMLGYIEKGTRFPSEALVRRLAAIRKQDAHQLLALLWRDRMVHAFGRELRRVLEAPRSLTGVDDAETAVLTSQAIAALPDDGSWITLKEWRPAFRGAPRRAARQGNVSDKSAKRVEEALLQRKLVEIRGERVRRRGRHFVAESIEEKQTLALEFCTLFVKGLLDKLALAEWDTGTYLREHYMNVEAERMPALHEKLESTLRGISEEFACEASDTSQFFNLLMTATPFGGGEAAKRKP